MVCWRQNTNIGILPRQRECKERLLGMQGGSSEKRKLCDNYTACRQRLEVENRAGCRVGRRLASVEHPSIAPVFRDMGVCAGVPVALSTWWRCGSSSVEDCGHRSLSYPSWFQPQHAVRFQTESLTDTDNIILPRLLHYAHPCMP